MPNGQNLRPIAASGIYQHHPKHNLRARNADLAGLLREQWTHPHTIVSAHRTPPPSHRPEALPSGCFWRRSSPRHVSARLQLHAAAQIGLLSAVSTCRAWAHNSTNARGASRRRVTLLSMSHRVKIGAVGGGQHHQWPEEKLPETHRQEGQSPS